SPAGSPWLGGTMPSGPGKGVALRLVHLPARAEVVELRGQAHGGVLPVGKLDPEAAFLEVPGDRLDSLAKVGVGGDGKKGEPREGDERQFEPARQSAHAVLRR